MKQIKILLGDPRHGTVGTHSNWMPVGVGYIGSNLIKEFKNNKIELKIETEPEEIFDAIEKWKPDIIGMANYMWNSDLSNFICTFAKKINPNTLCVLGGPEFPAGTGVRKIVNTSEDRTYDKSLSYLISRPSVDYFAYTDGEVSFIEIVKKFIENNFSVKSMKDKDEPMKGHASVSKDRSKLLVGTYIARIGMNGSVKGEGRDVIPSPYTTGLLDKFLDGNYMPAFETSRGCPFMCTFCDQGLDESKIVTHSVERLTEEMMYVGAKLSQIEKKTKTITIIDSNWGMFEKDIQLAHQMSKVVEKYDWPENIICTTPKSKWMNLLKMNDILKNRVQISLSMQSLSVETLSDIKRKSWTSQQYLDFLKELKMRGKSTHSDLIIPLPGETEESYFEGII